MQTREAQQVNDAVTMINAALQALPTDADRIRVAQLVLAPFQGALLRARLEAGREAKRLAGGYIGGRPTIGFRAQAGELVADAREQAIISRCLELRRDGRSYREIADILTDEGRRNRAGNTSWHPMTISRICRQPD